MATKKSTSKTAKTKTANPKTVKAKSPKAKTCANSICVGKTEAHHFCFGCIVAISSFALFLALILGLAHYMANHTVEATKTPAETSQTE